MKRDDSGRFFPGATDSTLRRGVYPAITIGTVEPPDPEWKGVEVLLFIVCVFVAMLALFGCSSTRDVATNEVQHETVTTTTVTEPVVVDLPIGQATVQPTRVVQTVDRRQTTDTKTRETALHEPSPAVMQAAQGISGVGMAGATGGLGALAYGAFKLLQMRKSLTTLADDHDGEKEAHDDTRRSLAETVKGIEAAKARLLLAGDSITGRQAWELVRTELERKQSGDTQERIRALLS